MDKVEGKDSNSRRDFLGSAGALGVAAIAGILNIDPTQAGASALGSRPVKLASIANLTVKREEIFDVPGGKEYFYEWDAGDKSGSIKSFTVHGSRIETDTTYTVTTDVTVRAKGSVKAKNLSTSVAQQRTITFGTKGAVSGDFRTDQVIVTTIRSDGTSTREESTVQVRLNFERVIHQSLHDHVLKAGRRRLASNG